MMRGAPTALLGATALVMTIAAAAQAQELQSGTRDPAFGIAGEAQAPFGARASATGGLALGPGGSITVAGDVRGSSGESTLVARFTPAGVLDPSFAGTGSRADRFGTSVLPQRAGAVAVAADGSTIVAGIAGSQIMVARYVADGTLDVLFGAGGITLRDLAGGVQGPEDSGLAAVALAPDGQVLVAGSIGAAGDDPYGDDEPRGEQIVVGRLSARGVPDPSFGSGGFAILQLGARSARAPARSKANALALLPDGRIAIAGRASNTAGSQRGFVARLTAAGRLDASFGRGGRLLVQLGQASAAARARSGLFALAPRAGGALLAAGSGSDVAGFDEIVLAGVTAAGTLDAGFGRDGVVRSQLGAGTASRSPRSAAYALAQGPAAPVYVASSGATLRFGASGRLDCSYGRLGQGLGFGEDGDATVYGLAVQPDGRLLGAGRQRSGRLELGRLIGGGPAAPAAGRTIGLRTLHSYFGGRGRAVAYGTVEANCGAANVRFVATPAAGGGRTVRSRPQRVSGAFGPQTVCAQLRGLTARRRYRVRIESVPRGVRPRGRADVVRTFPAPRSSPPQEGCS